MSLLELLISLSLATVLLGSLFGLYYGAARNAAADQNRMVTGQESRLILNRLTRDFRLVGLLAPLDVNGNADDIKRDVPAQAWSDSIREDFEYANTYDVVITSDLDNDGRTETVRYFRDAGRGQLKQTTWRWSRDSLRWLMPRTSVIASQVDYVLFDYFDRNGVALPNPVRYPSGGYTLTVGERRQVTAVQITVVTRAAHSDNAHPDPVTLPDGASWDDQYSRHLSRFLIRARNLSLGA
jgi:type II secretory pathway component PulJ